MRSSRTTVLSTVRRPLISSSCKTLTNYNRRWINPPTFSRRCYSQAHRGASRFALYNAFTTLKNNKFLSASAFSGGLAFFSTLYCDEKSRNRRAEHKEHRCDGCGAYPIVGPRYECMQCDNFDLCEKCIKKRKELHNPSHSYKEYDYVREDRNRNDDNRGNDRSRGSSSGVLAEPGIRTSERLRNRDEDRSGYSRQNEKDNDSPLDWGYGTPTSGRNARDDHNEGRERGFRGKHARYDVSDNKRSDMTNKEKRKTKVTPKPRRHDVPMKTNRDAADSKDREIQKKFLENEREAGQGENVSEAAADGYTEILKKQQGYQNPRGSIIGGAEEKRRIDAEVGPGRELSESLKQQVDRGSGFNDKHYARKNKGDSKYVEEDAKARKKEAKNNKKREKEDKKRKKQQIKRKEEMMAKKDQNTSQQDQNKNDEQSQNQKDNKDKKQDQSSSSSSGKGGNSGSNSQGKGQQDKGTSGSGSSSQGKGQQDKGNSGSGSSSQGKGQQATSSGSGGSQGKEQQGKSQVDKDRASAKKEVPREKNPDIGNSGNNQTDTQLVRNAQQDSKPSVGQQSKKPADQQEKGQQKGAGGAKPDNKQQSKGKGSSPGTATGNNQNIAAKSQGNASGGSNRGTPNQDESEQVDDANNDNIDKTPKRRPKDAPKIPGQLF